ncbi:hypothetical protein FGB62_15g11 [Gracilaria domingensis]|nr:hypothetical protein FGB62_15g11 [Gracilaria domingensis]
MSRAFISSQCGPCHIHTLSETDYSGYVYHSREAAKRACLAEFDKCGSELTPGRDQCIKREYGPLCSSVMQSQPTLPVFQGLPQKCFFTEAQLSECIAASGRWEANRRECYTEQSGAYWRYAAPGYTEKILGFCSSWTCANCEYNRVACQNRVFCEFNPIQPIVSSPSSISDYSNYCPTPNVMIPPNEAYWQEVRQYRGNVFVEEGSEVDCVNEYLGCHIPCTVDPSTPRGVNYARCLTDCICEQVSLVSCMRFSNIIHANLHASVRQENLTRVTNAGVLKETYEMKSGSKSGETIPTISRQWGANINVPSCLQRCRYWLN